MACTEWPGESQGGRGIDFGCPVRRDANGPGHTFLAALRPVFICDQVLGNKVYSIDKPGGQPRVHAESPGGDVLCLPTDQCYHRGRQDELEVSR